MDPHSLFPDLEPDTAVFLNAAADPAVFMRIRIQLLKIVKNYNTGMKFFLELEKTKRLLKIKKNNGAGSKFKFAKKIFFTYQKLQLLPISLHFSVFSLNLYLRI